MINLAEVFFCLVFLMVVAIVAYIVNIIDYCIDIKEIQEVKSTPLYITKEIYLDQYEKVFLAYSYSK